MEVGLRFPREKVRVRERGASQVALVVKNSPASVGDIRDVGLIPGLGRSPGEGNGDPLQCSCCFLQSPWAPRDLCDSNGLGSCSHSH